MTGNRMHVLPSSMKFGFYVVTTCIALGMTSGRVAAVTVEVAKKCEALTAKAYPPRVVGNPAAGSAKGSGRAQQAYFSKCVANDGKIEDIEGNNAKK